METILHVHCVGWCILLKGRLQLYAFCNTNHHGKWKQRVISPQLTWKQRAATHCNLSVFPKTDLKNYFNRGFHEMTSIVTGSFQELLLAVHDASTDCIDVSMRVGLRPILPLGAEIALTLAACKWTLGGHPFLRHACPFLDSPGKEKQLRVSSKVSSRESKNRHVWQDHFWARACKRLPSLFRDLTSIAAGFKLFSKPFANHLLFQSTRYLELYLSMHLLPSSTKHGPEGTTCTNWSGPMQKTELTPAGSCFPLQSILMGGSCAATTIPHIWSSWTWVLSSHAPAQIFFLWCLPPNAAMDYSGRNSATCDSLSKRSRFIRCDKEVLDDLFQLTGLCSPLLA